MQRPYISWPTKPKIFTLQPQILLIAGPQSPSEEGVRKEGVKDSVGHFVKPGRPFKKLLLSLFVFLPCLFCFNEIR